VNSKSTGLQFSKAPTTETVQSIAQYDQLPRSGRPQMLTTSDVCYKRTTVHQVRRSSTMKTSIHEYPVLRVWIVLDRWHQASGAHHALIAARNYSTTEARFAPIFTVAVYELISTKCKVLLMSVSHHPFTKPVHIFWQPIPCIHIPQPLDYRSVYRNSP